jgi:hypothetical protein
MNLQFLDKLRSGPKFLINCFLWSIFRFNKWHLRNVSTVRDYQGLVTRLTMEQGPEFVIELGCGLGEISRKIPRKTPKYLIDNDFKLKIPIKLIFFGHEYEFFSLDFSDTAKLLNSIPANDKPLTIIFVNSAHNLSDSQLLDLLKSFVLNFKVSKVLIDLTITGNENFRHDINSLSSIFELESFTPVPDLSANYGNDSGIAVLIPIV